MLGTWTQVRNAAAPVSYAARSQGLFSGLLTRSGGAAQLGAMATSGTVYTIVSRIAESAAATEWAMESLPTPKQPEPVPVPEHPALTLLRRPNAYMSGRDVIESLQQHVELTGEGYLVVSRGPRTGLPVELWPVRPDRMTPVPGLDGEFLVGWVYTGPDGEKVPLDYENVIQVKIPNPSDPYRGLGALQSVLTDIDSARLAAEWNRNFFVNSATPGGIIEIDEGLSDTEWRRMVDRWREQHQGVAQAHRVAILEKGKWIDRNYTLKDMQFAELRNIPREIVREAFGYPKAMLGAVDDVNRANAEAGEYVFSKWVLVPRLARLQSAFNTRLLPMFGLFGEGVQFCFESPVPEDEAAENAELTAKTTAYVALVAAGVTPDSASEVVGLPPMEHVAVDLPDPAGTGPGTSGDGAGADQREADQEEAGEGADVPTNAARKHVLGALRRPLNASAPRTLPDDATPDISASQTAWEAALAAILAQWSDVSGVQAAALVDQVRRVVASGDLTGLQSLNVSTSEGAAQLTAAMVDLASTSSDQVVAEARAQGVDITPVVPDNRHLGEVALLAAAILGHQLALAACVSATRAWGSTSTPEEVATAVRSYLNGLTDAQPKQVLGGALTQAQHDARLRTIAHGPAAVIYACESNDSNTCISCREIDHSRLGFSDDPSQPWLAAYPARGYVGCLGGDRCRGTVVAIWVDGLSWHSLTGGDK